VSDERSKVRREVIAKLEILALQHAAQHEELHLSAVEHGRDDMAQRALSNQTAWLEVARVLRSEIGRPASPPLDASIPKLRRSCE
jgi:hypothetical protein